jgi:hypothetical protein
LIVFRAFPGPEEEVFPKKGRAISINQLRFTTRFHLYQGFINKIATLWKTSIYLFILAVTLKFKD